MTEIYEQHVIYDMNGEKMDNRFILFVCGHVKKIEPKIVWYHYDMNTKTYYGYCERCKINKWVDSFGCLCCYTSTSIPTPCYHKKDIKKCGGITKKGKPCPYRSKINNQGFCTHHNNERIRNEKASDVLNIIPHPVMIRDINGLILKFI